MKVAFAQTEGFIAKPAASCRVFLLYGPDHGLVAEWQKTLCLQTVPALDDPFRVAVLTGAQLIEDPARLGDEVAAQAFGGGTRLVLIKDADDKLALALGKIIGDMAQHDCRMVITAGELGKNSKLRQLCEDSADAAALAAYPDEGPGRIRVVEQILRANSLSAERDTLEMIAANTPADRLALKSEIEKLAIYAHGQKTVSEDDVAACFGDGSTAEIDALVMAIFDGDVGGASRLLDRLYSEAVASVLIVRSLQRHLFRLQQGKALMAAGRSARDACENMRPPVFWKQKNGMTRQLQRWNDTSLARASAMLLQTEINCKQTGIPDQTVCRQAALALSRAA